MIAEPLAVYAFGPGAVQLPGLAHFAPRTAVPGASSFVVHFNLPGQAFSNSRCLAIFSRHTKGAVWWTLSPAALTATVTGMSFTSNS